MVKKLAILIFLLLFLPYINVLSLIATLEPAEIDVYAYSDWDFVYFNVSASASQNSTANITGIPHQFYPLGCATNGSLTLNLTTQPQNVTFEVNVSAFSVGTHYGEIRLEANGSILDTSLLVLEIKAVASVTIPSPVNATVEVGKSTKVYVSIKNNWDEYVSVTQASSYPSWCSFEALQMAPLEQKPGCFTFDASGLVAGSYSGVIKLACETEGDHIEVHDIQLNLKVTKPEQPEKPTGTYSVRIQVIDKDTLEDLSGSLIWDSSKKYDFTSPIILNLSAGSHLLEVYVRGYESQSATITVPDKTSFLFELTKTQQTQSPQAQPSGNQSPGKISLSKSELSITMAPDDSTTIRVAVIARGGPISKLQVVEEMEDPTWIVAALTKDSLQEADWCFLEVNVVTYGVEEGSYSKSFMVLGPGTNATFTINVDVQKEAQKKAHNSTSYPSEAPVIIVMLSDGTPLNPGQPINLPNGSLVHVYHSKDDRIQLGWTGGVGRVQVKEEATQIIETFMVTGSGALEIFATEPTLSGQQANITVPGVGRYEFRVVKKQQPKPVKFLNAAISGSNVRYTGDTIYVTDVQIITQLAGETVDIEPYQGSLYFENMNASAPDPFELGSKFYFEVVAGTGSVSIPRAGKYRLKAPNKGALGVVITVKPRKLDPVEVDVQPLVGRECKVSLGKSVETFAHLVYPAEGCAGFIQLKVEGNQLSFIPTQEGGYYSFWIQGLEQNDRIEVRYLLKITKPAEMGFWQKYIAPRLDLLLGVVGFLVFIVIPSPLNIYQRVKRWREARPTT